MNSDYEKWKKRREAKQAGRQRANPAPDPEGKDEQRSEESRNAEPAVFSKWIKERDSERADYEQWKKRRDAKRARREGDENSSVGGSYGDGASDIAYAPSDFDDSSSKGCGRNVRGCVGCMGLLLALLLLLGVSLSIVGALYWRQIEQAGRINVLVLGVDERTTESGPFRSDTMILTSFNPNQREVALLSIPRDLWLTIGNYGFNRINTAHFFGGPELAKETVRDNFAISLPYYVKLNFDGFTGIIDAMGGITVNVPEALHDENYPTEDYGVTTIDIPAGEQQMDGRTALIYARSRYSTSDFDRSRRQQEIIGAIQDKLTQSTTLLRVPAIFNAVRAAISTDIPVRQWPALGLILVRSDINRAVIGLNDTQNFVTEQGAQVLLPIWERIDPTMERYFR